MFNPVLKEVSADRLVYSTSVSFRIVFAVIAVFLAAAVRQPSVIIIIIIGACLFGALFLERWVFDKNQNVFEKNVGILVLYTRKRQPLDNLDKVLLREAGLSYSDRPKMMKAISRRTAILSVVDGNGTVHGLDMVKGSSIKEIRASGTRLADFCNIPFDDGLEEEEEEGSQI